MERSEISLAFLSFYEFYSMVITLLDLDIEKVIILLVFKRVSLEI